MSLTELAVKRPTSLVAIFSLTDQLQVQYVILQARRRHAKTA